MLEKIKAHLEAMLQQIRDGVTITEDHIKEALTHFDTGIKGVIVELAADATADATGVAGIPGVSTEVQAAAEAPAPTAQS